MPSLAHSCCVGWHCQQPKSTSLHLLCISSVASKLPCDHLAPSPCATMNDDVFAGQPLLELCLLEWQVAPPLEQRQLKPQVCSSYTYDMWTPNTYTPARGPQTTNLYDRAFFDLRPKMLVYTCFAAHVSIHMACGNLAAHTAL